MTKQPTKKKRGGGDPLQAFCRSLPGATEDIKWGKDLIFSVGGRVSVTDRSRVPVETLEELLAESHRLVAAALSKKMREKLGIGEN